MIAFRKKQSEQCRSAGATSEVDNDQLRELGIRRREKKEVK